MSISSSCKKPNGAFVIVEDPLGNVLLTLNKRDPKQYELPGGGQDVDEALAVTAARETFEEVGLDVNPVLIGKLKTRLPNGSDVFLFHAKIETINPFLIFCPQEVSEAIWIGTDALKVFLAYEKDLRDLKQSHKIVRAHFVMLTVFQHWRIMGNSRVIEGYLSAKDGDPLTLESFLKV